MKRLWLTIFLMFATLGVALGQTTTTSLTTSDPDGTAWNAGTYSIQYINSIPGKPYNTSTGAFITTLYSGSLNSSGALSLTLDDVKYISPANGTWAFTICPNVSGGASNCSTVDIPVTGASENVSSLVNAALRAPRPGGGVGAYGYADVEFQSIPGNTYVVSPALTVQRCYAGSWAACGSGGGGSLPSVQVENVFTGAGTINFQHNLNDEYPLYSCFSLSGASAYTAVPVDANNMAITVSAAATILCAFQKTAGLVPNFSFTVSPSTSTYNPTMGGTQTPTFAISQTGTGGYSGVVTYSTTGLAGGMSSSYSPPTITGSGSSTLSVSFPATQAAGLTTITASGTDGTLTHTNPIALTISGINTNLVDGWPMEEGSGTTFFPGPATSNNQTFSAGIGTWGSVVGIGTNAFTFNATGHAVGTNATNTNFNYNNAFTISAWIKPTTVTAYGGILANLNGSNNGYAIRVTTNGGIELLLSGVVGSNWIQVESAGSLTANVVAFITVTYSGSGLASGVTLYVNGVAQTPTVLTDNLAGNSTASTTPIMIGQDGAYGDKFSGAIGYVRVYNVALTGTQVSTLYAAGPN